MQQVNPRGLVVLVAALTVLWTAGEISAEDRRATPCRLSIMTLNAESRWDGMAPEEGQADFPWKHSSTEAEDHMRAVAAIIVRSDPDMINLVEVENLPALTMFNIRFLTGRGYHPSLVDGKDTATGHASSSAVEKDQTCNEPFTGGAAVA